MNRTFTYLFTFWLVGQTLHAQSLNYTFSEFNSTFTNLGVGASEIITTSQNDVLSATQNIGFVFDFNGTTYTQFKASSNGFLTFNTAATLSLPTNNLNTGGNRPLLAPLWDDLATHNTGSGVFMQVTGTAPNRVCTVEWRMMRWDYAQTSASLSFQVRLYETTNNIEFHYRRETFPGANRSASIGLAGQTSGDFYSVNLPANVTTYAPPFTATKAAEATHTGRPEPGRCFDGCPQAIAVMHRYS